MHTLIFLTIYAWPELNLFFTQMGMLHMSMSAPTATKKEKHELAQTLNF